MRIPLNRASAPAIAQVNGLGGRLMPSWVRGSIAIPQAFLSLPQDFLDLKPGLLFKGRAFSVAPWIDRDQRSKG